MDELDLPEDLQDIEVIYSDEENEDERVDHLMDDISLQEGTDEDFETEIIDISVLTLQKHKKAVFCSDLSADNKVAATGGEDDMAYLWSTETGDILMECSGHKDSIVEVRFNFDSQYVATADMAGMLQVWIISDKKLVWCYEGDDLECLLWHPVANVLFCGCQSGDIYLWQIPQGNCKVLVAQNNASVTCAKILPNGKQLLAGYKDGCLRLWNIKECSVEWSSKVMESVISLDVNKEGTLAVVAPESKLIKLNDGKLLTTLLPESESEIEAALIHPDLGVIASGSISGQLCVWEIGRYALRHMAKIECAVTVMKWGADGKIFIGATDGAVYVCDVKSGTLHDTLTGHSAEILSISVFNDNKILTTSEDGTAKIFATKN